MSATLATPSIVSLDSAGNIYIADRFNYRVRKVTVSTGIITTIAGIGTNSHSGDGSAATSAGLCDPMALEVDASGRQSTPITTVISPSYSDSFLQEMFIWSNKAVITPAR
jgi:hypothetical protein